MRPKIEVTKALVERLKAALMEHCWHGAGFDFTDLDEAMEAALNPPERRKGERRAEQASADLYCVDCPDKPVCAQRSARTWKCPYSTAPQSPSEGGYKGRSQPTVPEVSEGMNIAANMEWNRAQKESGVGLIEIFARIFRSMYAKMLAEQTTKPTGNHRD